MTNTIKQIILKNPHLAAIYLQGMSDMDKCKRDDVLYGKYTDIVSVLAEAELKHGRVPADIICTVAIRVFELFHGCSVANDV